MSTVFEWLDGHPSFFWLSASLATLALLLWIVGGVYAAARERATCGSGWKFAVLLLLFLAAWRWPFLLCAAEYNPDESQFIAGAITLAHDPVFWRSVDGVTSGPLDFYALLPLHLVGLPLDYFSARLTALLLIWASLLCLYRLLRTLVVPAVAQLAVLPGAVFFAAATVADFVHYSSELVPVALLSLAIALVAKRPMAAALVAGCLGWAKLQAAPLCVAFVAWQLWQTWHSREPGQPKPWRRSLQLIAWAGLPSLFTLGGVLLTGQGEHFFRRYFLQNVAYVKGGLPHDTVLHDLTRFARESGHFFPWLAASLFFLLLTGTIYFRRRRDPVSPYFWLGAILTASAVFCIFAPARASLHYTLFLIVPLTLWSGVLVGCLWSQGRARGWLAVLAFACALTPLYVRLKQPVPHMFGHFAEHWRYPYSPLGMVERHWHKPGAKIAVWGWNNAAYVESGLPQAVRDAVSQWCILDIPQREYYRATYLADMERNRPELFVDSVGRGAPFFFERLTQAHEIFPALAEYVRKNYHLVIDLQFARVYVRTDALQQVPLTASDLQHRLAEGRIEYGPVQPPERTTPNPLPRSRVNDNEVLMIEPPAELSWPLTGMERRVRIDFGMHPKSYTEGNTDGVELIAELRMPGQPPLQVCNRLMDPAHQAADRLPLSADADLPPYPPGTVLVVRTASGKAGNTAWDWAYFNLLRFSISPVYLPRQFPGFRRVPSHVDAAYPYLVRSETESILMLPPPAALTFVLDGNERQLNFAYGLAEGAYTGPGQSDGAIYIVELLRDGAPPRNLFTHRLDPLGAVADRGRQYADLMLPADVRAGDRIVLRIDAGATSSWDWTYLAALDLR